MSSFRTIELSDGPYEQDGLRFLTVKTDTLKGRGDICLYVPEVATTVTNLPIYILLHGVYGSAWIWALKGGAHHTAKRLMEAGEIAPAIIAMPSDGLWGDGSGYLAHQEKDFAHWIVSDVPKAVMENIPQAGPQSKICLGGLSMGGYGALHLGSSHPDTFQAISAHSAITTFDGMANFVEEPLTSYPLKYQKTDVIDKLRSAKEKLPPFRFDCGTEDDLLFDNRSLHRQLKELEIPHSYQEFKGGHEWPYWQKNVAHSLRFFDQHCSR